MKFVAEKWKCKEQKKIYNTMKKHKKILFIYFIKDHSSL